MLEFFTAVFLFRASVLFDELTITRYLLDHELISSELIVDGDLVVSDFSRRNHNFKVSSLRGPCYLVKQAIDPDGIATLANEARVYELFQANTDDEFVSYLPRYYGYDPRKHTLILELLREARDINEWHTQRGQFPLRFAKALGSALSRMHSVTRAGGKCYDRTTQFSGSPAWVLSIQHPDISMFRTISSANLELVRVIQQTPGFSELLDNLHSGWQFDGLIHNDLRWDNCLVLNRSVSNGVRLKIVDWEFACFGDQRWDVASVLSNYLSCWILSIPSTSGGPPDELLRLARYPFHRIAPAIREFWNAYSRGLRLSSATRPSWLERVVAYTGATLVQTAYEYMQASMYLTGNILSLLRISLNLMARPQEAAVQLLGFPWEKPASG